MNKKTLKTIAYEEIKRLILNGELEGGSFVTENQLVDILNMSRTPIRSALIKLEMEGFINKSAKQGIIIENISISKAIDIYDFRMALESYIIKKIVEQGLSEKEKAVLLANLEQQKQCVQNNDIEEFSKVDYDFHLTLARIYDNKEIIFTLESISEKLKLIAITVMNKRTKRIKSAYEEHKRIYDCIIKKDVEQATVEIINHFKIGENIFAS